LPTITGGRLGAQHDHVAGAVLYETSFESGIPYEWFDESAGGWSQSTTETMDGTYSMFSNAGEFEYLQMPNNQNHYDGTSYEGVPADGVLVCWCYPVGEMRVQLRDADGNVVERNDFTGAGWQRITADVQAGWALDVSAWNGGGYLDLVQVVGYDRVTGGRLGAQHEYIHVLTSGRFGAQHNLSPVLVRHGRLDAQHLQDGEPVEPPVEQRARYLVRITGAPDGLSDLYVPITAFNYSATLFVDVQEATTDHLVYVNGVLIHKETSPREEIQGLDYRLQVTVPGVELANEIRARSNGSIVLERERTLVDGSLETVELYRGPYTGLQTQRGGRNASLQFWGEDKSEGVPAQQGVRIRDLFYTSTDEQDIMRIRAAPINELRPGDQVEVDGETREVKEVQFRIGPETFSMTLQCGAPL
jgi:hypothetical protein